MTTQLLIYGQVQAITQQRHKDLYVKTGTDYSFAKEVNSVPLMAIEFPHAAPEYPIVFAGDEKSVSPVVVLGTNEKENLFMDEDVWNAKYIPAFVRRYPFIYSSSDEGKTLTLCIDEEYEGCNEEGRGERLFETDGERTQFLESTLKFLEDYQQHYRRTQGFCEKLIELELLESMQAQFAVANTENAAPRTLTGFWGINREKLKNLDEATLKSLMSSDGLELAYLHLQSMRNFSSVAEKSKPAESDDA